MTLALPDVHRLDSRASPVGQSDRVIAHVVAHVATASATPYALTPEEYSWVIDGFNVLARPGTAKSRARTNLLDARLDLCRTGHLWALERADPISGTRLICVRCTRRWRQ